MIKRILIFLLIVLFLSPSSAFPYGFRTPVEPQTYDTSQWKKESLYIDRAFGKFAFGAWNLMLGWTEIVRKPYEESEVGRNVFVGILKGIAYAGADMAGGALNIATFPITTLNIPLPEGGVEGREF